MIRSIRACGMAAVAGASCLLAQGCALPGAVGPPEALNPSRRERQEPMDDVVATDMVSALMQLPALSPWGTTVQMSEPTPGFGQAVQDALIASGYGLQSVDADNGTHYVSYSRGKVQTTAGTYREYALTIGTVTARRLFDNVEEVIRPASPMVMTGTEPASVRLHPDLYLQNGSEPFPDGVEFHADNGSLLEASADGDDRVGDNMAGRLAGDRVQHERFLIMTRSDLYRTSRQTAQQRIGTDYQPVKQLVLRFPTDDVSLLGATNKAAIANFVNAFARPGDAYSVTGCSHGKSLIWDGTERASLDRMRRVRDELVVAGAGTEAVREESCFDDKYTAHLIERSTVITLLRTVSG